VTLNPAKHWLLQEAREQREAAQRAAAAAGLWAVIQARRARQVLSSRPNLVWSARFTRRANTWIEQSAQPPVCHSIALHLTKSG
jgi:hypothetical protein